MSTTISAVLVNLLSVLLPYLGVTAGSEQLTTTIQTLIAIGSGLWIWKERVAKGGVSKIGLRQ